MSQSLRVMLVEDERVVSMTLARMVTRMGHRVVAQAPSGEEALELFDRARPDLVLMDIMLDGTMDGIDTAREMIGQRPVHLVFVTAYGDAPTRLKAMDTRPAGFVHKPVDYAVLQYLLQDLPGPADLAEA